MEKLLKIVEKQQSQAQSDECSWRFDWLDGSLSFREPLGQMKVMQIRQGDTKPPEGGTHEVCCLAAQLKNHDYVLIFHFPNFLRSVYLLSLIKGS